MSRLQIWWAQGSGRFIPSLCFPFAADPFCLFSPSVHTEGLRLHLLSQTGVSSLDRWATLLQTDWYISRHTPVRESASWSCVCKCYLYARCNKTRKLANAFQVSFRCSANKQPWGWSPGYFKMEKFSVSPHVQKSPWNLTRTHCWLSLGHQILFCCLCHLTNLFISLPGWLPKSCLSLSDHRCTVW